MKIILFLFLVTSFLIAKPVGEIVTVKGIAFIKKNQQNKFIKLKNGFKIENGDFIKTTKRGKVKIIFNDNSIIFIGNKSKIKIDEYQFDLSNKKRNVKLSLLSGKLKSWVSKLAFNKRKFKIKTPTATIGVRGTQFVVSVNEDNSTEVGVLEGSVVVKNLFDTTQKSLLLTINKFTKVIDEMPIKSSDITSEYLSKTEDDFDIEMSIDNIPVNFSQFRSFNLKKTSINNLNSSIKSIKNININIKNIIGNLSIDSFVNQANISKNLWQDENLDKWLKNSKE